jgi:hypothetical protein
MNTFLSRYIMVGIALFVGAIVFHAWLNARAVQRQIESSLRTQEGVIASVNSAEAKRDQSLQGVLNEISKVKHATKTPLQVVTELPKYLPLPAPISLTSAVTHQLSENSSLLTASTGDSPPSPVTPGEAAFPPKPAVGYGPKPDVELPTQDLKPLFDFVQDCRSCEIELEAARQLASANSAKLTAVTRERDLALKAAKGGSNWIRLRRGFEWFAVGALAGYAARR